MTPLPEKLKDLLKQRWEAQNQEPWHGWLVAIDPGETTGVVALHDTDIAVLKQVKTPGFSNKPLRPDVEDPDPLWWQVDSVCCRNETVLSDFDEHTCTIVLEDYRIYGWKSDEHAWSDVHTLRLIGAIEHAASIYEFPLYKQSAHQGKSFWNDQKLERFGLTEITRELGSDTKVRHTRDALRHALQFLTFTYPKLQLQSNSD